MLHNQVTGVRLPRTTRQQFQRGRLVTQGQLRPGDLIFFETVSAPVSHVGIWLGDDQFVHASTSRGVTISSIRETYYMNRYRGARRFGP